MSHINPKARWLFWSVFLLFVLSVAKVAFGQEIGKPWQAVISVCLDKEEAIQVVNGVKDGTANALFDKFEKCANVPVVSTPVKVVYSLSHEGKTYRVVEIKVGKETAYWLTSMQIKGLREA
jgi:hypothetical protein